MSQEGTLTTDEIEDILSEEKPNQIPKMKFNADRIRNVLPKNIEEKKLKILLLMPLNFMGNISKDKSLWTQDSGSYYSTNPSLQSSLVLLLTIYLLTEKSI